METKSHYIYELFSTFNSDLGKPRLVHFDHFFVFLLVQVLNYFVKEECKWIVEPEIKTNQCFKHIHDGTQIIVLFKHFSKLEWINRSYTLAGIPDHESMVHM